MRCRQAITAGIAALSMLGFAVNGAVAQEPLNAEAIVVGAGPSGLAAAVEMGRAGVNVLVLDMNSVMGGHAVMAGGFAIVDTPLQARLGHEDSAELAVSDWLAWTEDGDPDWTRFYAERSRELIYDWLGDMNVEFIRVAGGWENSVPRFHFTPRGAIDVVRALFREALAMPNVDFEWNENVDSLLVEDGRVSGVVELEGDVQGLDDAALGPAFDPDRPLFGAECGEPRRKVRYSMRPLAPDRSRGQTRPVPP